MRAVRRASGRHNKWMQLTRSAHGEAGAALAADPRVLRTLEQVSGANPMNARTLARHGLALIVALGALFAMPVLLLALLSGLSAVFGMKSGFHIYDASVEGPGIVGLILTLAAVCGTCLLGQLARRRWRHVSWALPLIPGVVVGTWVAFVARGGDMPITWPIVHGLTAGVLVSVVVGSYWLILQLMPERSQGAAEQ